MGALLATALATVLLIAPVSFHRLVFRRRLKAALIEVGDRMLRAGLALLVLAITSGVLLVLDVVLGRGPGVAAAAGGLQGFFIALVLGVLGFVVGRVLDGELDVNQFVGRGRDR